VKKIKLYCAALTLILAALIFPSCSAIPGYSEPEEQAVVCAIGFDVVDGRVKVTLQLAESGGEKFRSVEGDGRSIDEAVAYITAKESSSLEVSHLAIVAIGRGIDKSWFDNILDFCDRGDAISTSANLISTNDANALLSIEDASGYRLSEMISSTREDSSLGAQSRLYKIRNMLSSDVPVFALPHFFADGEDFELYGLHVFRSGTSLSVLDRNEGAYYMMIQGLYDGGILGGDATGLAMSVGVSKCRTKYVSRVEGDSAILTVRLMITLDSEIADDKHADEILRATKKNAEELYEKLSSLHGDVFGFYRIAERDGVGKASLESGLSVRFECEKRR